MSKACELAAATARITGFEPPGSGVSFRVTPYGKLSVNVSQVFRELSESEALDLLNWLINMFGDCIEVGDA